MQRLFSFIFSVLVVMSIQAQYKLMGEGKDALLVTYKGDSIWGKAEVDLENEWVQIKGEQGFKVIEFPKIVSLRLYDTEENSITAYRRYWIDSERSELLQQVVIGSIHFLKRAQPRTYVDYTGTPMLNSTNNVIENQYFLWHSGELVKLKNFKKQLFSLASEREVELIMNFRKENKLQYHKDYDQAVLINYLNKLQKERQLAAVTQL